MIPHHGDRTPAVQCPVIAVSAHLRHNSDNPSWNLAGSLCWVFPSVWPWTPSRWRWPRAWPSRRSRRGTSSGLAFHFGLFQFMMPIIGWLAGEGPDGTDRRIRQLAGVCFAGLRRREDALGGPGPKNAENGSDPTRGLRLVTLSVATSIDALAVGMSMAFLGVSVWFPSVVIGVVTATLTAIGVAFGGRIGSRWGRWADVAGGIVLILLGLRVLLTG